MIAVIGASGQLGTSIVSLLGNRAEPITRRNLDLTDVSSIARWVDEQQPEAIVNCAAYTAVDAAEQDEASALLVNAIAVEELAKAAKQHSMPLVTFSTDYVFDGTKDEPYVESDTPNPLSAYGRSKLEGERRSLEVNPDTLVIRTSWVLSGTHRNFVATILELLRKSPVDVVTDQVGKPTLTDDLATAVAQCLDHEVTGILHMANDGPVSWFELAREVATLAGLNPELVRPTTSEQFKRPAPRPANSVLDSERLAKLDIDPLPHHLDSLPTVVDSLISRGY